MPDWYGCLVLDSLSLGVLQYATRSNYCTYIIRYWGTKVQLYIRAGSSRGTKVPLIILLRSAKHAVLNYAFY